MANKIAPRKSIKKPNKSTKKKTTKSVLQSDDAFLLKETDGYAKGGVIKKTYLPDEIEHRGTTYVFDAKKDPDYPKSLNGDHIIVEVMSPRLRGKRDLHGDLYEPSKYVFVPKGTKSYAKGGQLDVDHADLLIKGVPHKMVDHAPKDHQLLPTRREAHPFGDVYVDGDKAYVESGYGWLEFPTKDIPAMRKARAAGEFEEGGAIKKKGEFRFKKGDIVYVFRYANNETNINVVGKGDSKQSWEKVEIVEPWSDELYWETYKVKHLGGHRGNSGKMEVGNEFIASQDQMSTQNKEPIPIGYVDKIVFAEKGKKPMKWHKKPYSDGGEVAECQYLILDDEGAYRKASKEDFKEKYEAGHKVKDKHGKTHDKADIDFEEVDVVLDDKGKVIAEREYGYAKGGEINQYDLKDAFEGYAEAALWTDEDLDGYAIIDIDEASVKGMKETVRKFLIENASDIKDSGLDYSQVGHDLWLSRNGYGAGFEDREGVPESVGKRLSESADKLGQCTLYSEDEKIYVDGKFEKGGVIPNNYEGKTPKEVWNDWTPAQREHFLDDHSVLVGTDWNKDFIYDKADMMPAFVMDALKKHIKKGQYKNGGKIEKQYTPKDLPKEGVIEIHMPEMGGLPEKNVTLKYDKDNFNYAIYQDGKKKSTISEKDLLWKLNQGEYELMPHQHKVWEGLVTDAIATKLNISHGDAAAIVEAHPFELAQCWGKNLNANDTADKIAPAANGWRYTEAGAERLGVTKDTIPTQEHIDKFRDKKFPKRGKEECYLYEEKIKDEFADGGEVGKKCIVDGRSLVYEKWDKVNGGNGISGTIRTTPENYYIATIDENGGIDFSDVESMTRDINKEEVIKKWDSKEIPTKKSYADGGEIKPSYFGTGDNISVFGHRTRFFVNDPSASDEFLKAMDEIEKEYKDKEAYYDKLKDALMALSGVVDEILEIEENAVEYDTPVTDTTMTLVSELLTKVGMYNYKSGFNIKTTFLGKHIVAIASRLPKSEVKVEDAAKVDEPKTDDNTPEPRIDDEPKGDDHEESKTDDEPKDDDVVPEEETATVEDQMARGGRIEKHTKFMDKVNAIAQNLKGKKVPKKYQKTEGHKFTLKTAKAAATKIAGKIVAGEKKVVKKVKKAIK